MGRIDLMSVSKSRILIADPDPDVSETLKLYLETHHHEVKLLKHAGEVAAVTRQWQPNAVVISTELSDQNPHKVCQTLIEDTLTSHIPIIMLLHVDNRRAKMEALEVGVDDVLSKPVDLEELQLRIEAAIRFSTLRMQT
jgi:DNA-binding response OmpR family regulator